jgi:hypothetical protein
MTMESMSAFEKAGTRGFYRPSCYLSAGQLADLVTAALALARATGLHDLLVNITEMTGFESAGPAYCRWDASRWAETAVGALRVTFVARSEQIYPEKIGPLVAAEEGLHAYICEDEAEAIAWLNAEADAPTAPGGASVCALACGRPCERTEAHPGQQSGVPRWW